MWLTQQVPPAPVWGSCILSQLGVVQGDSPVIPAPAQIDWRRGYQDRLPKVMWEIVLLTLRKGVWLALGLLLKLEPVRAWGQQDLWGTGTLEGQEPAARQGQFLYPGLQRPTVITMKANSSFQKARPRPGIPTCISSAKACHSSQSTVTTV